MVEATDQLAMAVRLFQYSLCRVVLMVTIEVVVYFAICLFQYSLCRVVLMVSVEIDRPACDTALSVLALSSRFDGRRNLSHSSVTRFAFSTRSVESF